jgi:cation diffusion facilitator family transporter
MMKSSKAKIALRVSLGVSVLLFCVKMSAFFLTDSSTVFSDAADSVIHILAVSFVYYGFLLSTKPADDKHLYGHERVEFFSVGIEGSVIVIAGLIIIYESITKFIHGHILQHLSWGIGLLAAAGLINLAMGTYLVKTGEREHNMIVLSNGKHTLADVWISLGAVITLIIITFTGWLILDTIVGLIVAIYIMFEGYKLLRYAVNGLMDRKNPAVDSTIRNILKNPLPGTMISFHNLRHRTTGDTTWIELHAIFKKGIGLDAAHEDATLLEKRLINGINGDVIVTIHLEPEGSHRKAHRDLKNADQQRPLDDFI